jgi:hypothetical protein
MTIKVPSNEFRIRIPYFHISVHIINLALNDMKFPPIVFRMRVPYFKLTLSPQNVYGRHHDLVTRYRLSVPCVSFVEVIIQFFFPVMTYH